MFTLVLTLLALIPVPPYQTETNYVDGGLACRSKTITSCHLDDHCVCPAPKKVKKVVKKKTVVISAPSVHSKTDCCASPTVINVNVEQNQLQEQNQEQDQTQKQKQKQLQVGALVRPTLTFGVLGAIGSSFCLPQGYLGLLGIEGHYYPWHLGARIYSEFYWGYGAQLMVFPIQTEAINWHLSGGVYGFNHRPYVALDTPRQLDLTVGTGLEVKVLPHIYITGDLRVRIPNPVAMAALGGVWPRVGESFSQTQLLLGIMVGN